MVVMVGIVVVLTIMVVVVEPADAELILLHFLNQEKAVAPLVVILVHHLMGMMVSWAVQGAVQVAP
jgi:hypothetical protein